MIAHDRLSHSKAESASLHFDKMGLTP
ncbi:hypothetical protein PB2503_11829 [Parvularcula bermudensis HTCC2503]|uniref:Uncharacterized protein n=1 Tax=Parvularcula bermudensis (strain ATCC BAA-594 / HTCC2503 / KCTC 12087) TaxID=314260 RepID=E0TDW1_PARBH|nr:hypothetical protein PB2503_11829 [Parvularcula bermudensis HTCC2503]